MLRILLTLGILGIVNTHEEVLDYTKVYHDDDDDNWETGSLGNVSYVMSSYITVLSKEDFLREYENERTLFDDVVAVRSFFKDRPYISKGNYIELLLYFIDGRHEQLL